MDANVGIPNASKGVGKSLISPVMQKVHLPQVSPDTSGEGLPYAPVNWPNDGDVWAWKVGKRFSSTGFFYDRFLVVPKHLHSTGVRCLGSRQAVVRYIQSRWPEADISAFFASFSWKVPAKVQFVKKVPKDTPCPRKVPKLQAKRVCGQGTHRRIARKHHLLGQRTRRSSRQLAQFSTKDANTIIDLCSESDATATATDMSGHTTTDSNKPHGFDSPAHSSSLDDPTYPLEKLRPEAIPEDFDDYLNSLDVILAQPLQCVQVSPPTAQLIEARTKLSAILHMDLCALLSSKDLVTEVMTLSTMLQKDSTLSAPEQSTLKLIDEIPVRIKDFEETKKVKADAERFFTDLEANIVRASNLKSDYTESGKNASLLHDEIKSASLAIEDIDEHISVLQSRRAQTTAAMEKAKREIARFTSKQEVVARHLPKVVREVQLAQFGRSEWELKNKIAADQEVKILEKFSPLKGFPF